MTTTMTRPQQQTQLAKVDERTVLAIPDLRKLVGSRIDLIRDALPEKMRGAAPRFAIALVSACQATPKLAECTAFSLLGGLVKAANLGLEIGDECWLIPRNQKDNPPRGQAAGPDFLVANFQTGWKGIVTMLYRNPRVARVSADSVRKGDEFEHIQGTESRIVHKYGKVRGEVTDFYAVIKLTSGECITKVMTVAEIDDHRKRFSQFGTGPNGVRKGTWLDNFDAMARKTVIIQAAKTAPRSIELPESAMAEEAPIVPDNILPAAAEQPRQVAGEISGDTQAAASLEDLDTLTGFLAGQEDREGSDIEFDVCQSRGKRMYSDLTADERLDVFKVLEKRASQN